MDDLTEWTLISFIYPTIVETLNYQSASRLARTCRRFANAWMEFCVRDVNDRIMRFYRGAALRTAGRTRAPPAEPFSDHMCIVESVYFGLTTTQEELQDLHVPQSTINELLAVSRALIQVPHNIPCTRAKSLVCLRGNGSEWRQFPMHGKRVRCAVDEVLRVLGDNSLPSPAIARAARDGHVYAMPHVVAAYFNRFGAPRLPSELFGSNIRRAERAASKHRLAIAAFRIFYVMAFTLFGYRVRSRAKGFSSLIPMMPANIDASEAWYFVMLNGLTFRASALDAIVNRSAYRDDLQHGSMEHQSLFGKYLCAQRYLQSDCDLVPPSPTPTVFGNDAWMRTVLDRKYDSGLSALFKENRFRNTHELCAPNDFDLPSIYIVQKYGLVISTAAERKRLACISRRALDNNFCIQWTPHALELRYDEPLRSCILRFLRNAHTVHVDPINRCSQCKRILRSHESIDRGLGPDCAKRIKLSIY